MENFVKLAGIIFISIGVWLLIDTKMHRKIISFFITGSRVYIAAAARIALGLLFILAAGDCTRPKVISIIGIIALVAGIAVFALGLEKSHAMLQWLQARSDVFYKISCIFLFALGVLTIYAS